MGGIFCHGTRHSPLQIGAGSCSSNSIPSLGTSIGHGCGPENTKKTKKKKKKKNGKKITLRCHYIPTRRAEIQSTNRTKCRQEGGPIIIPNLLERVEVYAVLLKDGVTQSTKDEHTDSCNPQFQSWLYAWHTRLNVDTRTPAPKYSQQGITQMSSRGGSIQWDM